jgi:hypothetical protein
MPKRITGSRRAVKTTVPAPHDLAQLDLFANPLPGHGVDPPVVTAADQRVLSIPSHESTPATAEG